MCGWAGRRGYRRKGALARYDRFLPAVSDESTVAHVRLLDTLDLVIRAQS